MQAKVETNDLWQELYNRLFQLSSGNKSDELLAVILSSWALGSGALPQYLGMSRDSFTRMLDTRFQGFRFDESLMDKAELEAERLDEHNEVLQLMLGHVAGQAEAESWVAEIVTSACQGQDHLWQDLGLRSRVDLSDLMSVHFPALAAKNDKDMKWKKFIYKQLCITEGIYTCRAPSCEVCSDYDNCFGPEE
jgi:nitrogen fixation protein NifQ